MTEHIPAGRFVWREGDIEFLPPSARSLTGETRAGPPDEPRDEKGQWTVSPETGSGKNGPDPGARAKMQPYPKDITPAEITAVESWVSNYDKMHAIQMNPESADAKTFESAVRQSPPFGGTIYRGINMGTPDDPGGHADPATLEAGRQFWEPLVGGQIVIRDPVSTSPVPEVAGAYADPLLFEIDQNGKDGGREITWVLNAAERENRRFREVILAPGRYSIESIRVAKIVTSFFDKTKTSALVVHIRDISKDERAWHSLRTGPDALKLGLKKPGDVK